MKRSTVIGDRLVTFLFAIGLIALALFSICWWRGSLIDLPVKLSASWSRTIENKSWYPWAVGGAGIVLCMASTGSLLAHLRQHRVSELRIASEDAGTSLRLNLGAALSAASDALEESLGIRSVHASAIHEGRAMVCSFSVKIDPQADLCEVAKDCDRVISDLKKCVGRADLKCRSVISTTSRKTSLVRVS